MADALYTLDQYHMGPDPLALLHSIASEAHPVFQVAPNPSHLGSSSLMSVVSLMRWLFGLLPGIRKQPGLHWLELEPHHILRYYPLLWPCPSMGRIPEIQHLTAVMESMIHALSGLGRAAMGPSYVPQNNLAATSDTLDMLRAAAAMHRCTPDGNCVHIGVETAGAHPLYTPPNTPHTYNAYTHARTNSRSFPLIYPGGLRISVNNPKPQTLKSKSANGLYSLRRKATSLPIGTAHHSNPTLTAFKPKY